MNTALAPALRVENVSFSYPRRQVLRNITWESPDGITALMGPNGTGKTTLLRLLAGELKPTEGTISTGGAVRGSTSLGSHVGYLPQHYTFVNSMRTWEAAAHTAWSAGLDRKTATTAAHEALASVDLTEKAKDKIGSLSGGQKQRLAIACTLAPRPSLLLLDEPSVGLDPIQRVTLRDLLHDLGERIPIVLSTHLVDDVTELAQSILVLSDGEVRFAGSSSDFTAGASMDEAYRAAVLGVRS